MDAEESSVVIGVVVGSGIVNPVKSSNNKISYVLIMGELSWPLPKYKQNFHNTEVALQN